MCVSVTPDKNIAESQFRRALELAESSQNLPDEWLEHTQRIGVSTSKTFIAMFGTALLARATDSRIDPLILRADVEAEPGFESYSARGLATGSLAPLAVEYGIDIGTKGREPLNNQPFLRDTHVHKDMNVKANAKEDLDYLVDALEAVKALAGEEILSALAAFLKVRKAVSERRVPNIKVVNTQWTVEEFVSAVTNFVTSQPEGGRRGQAFVGAALDLVYPYIEVGRVNDPSRHYPGDVRAFENDNGDMPPLRSIEVKQKSVAISDIYLWAAELAEAGLGLGIYVGLEPSQPKLNRKEVVEKILARHNVLVRIYESAEEFLRAALIWSGKSLEDFLEEFPLRMQERMREMDVSHKGHEEWVSSFGI